MGVPVEFNTVLALRASGTSGRAQEECIPRELKTGSIYSFLKKDLRIYPLHYSIPLVQTDGVSKSPAVAEVRILKVVHLLEHDVSVTRGEYKIERLN